MSRSTKSSVALLLTLTVIVVAAVVLPGLLAAPARLVVYCAHDADLADGVIQRFEAETGIQVDVRYDEEASKSLGLVNLLLAEKDHPRADVFWNNQLLGTLSLQQSGVLQPWQGSGWQRMPDGFRDPDGFWTAFAARCRVFVVNTDQLAADEQAVAASLQQDRLSHVAIAEPLFGTTLSHYCVLAEKWGMEKLQNWHRDTRQRGIREVRGNAMSRDLVVQGVCAVGYTDTDDAFAAIDDGAPVAMLPVRLETGQTLCLPNSIAMIAGCRHPQAAQRFIDFVLSEETEVQLAHGSGRQIPLGPVDADRLPEELRLLLQWAQNAVPLAPAAEYHEPVRQWLAAELTGQ